MATSKKSRMSSPVDKLAKGEKAKLEKLSKKAQSEIANLLKASKAGSITQTDLHAKLVEIGEAVKTIYPFGFKI